MLRERPERIGGHELQTTQDDDHANQQADKQRTVGRERAGALGQFRLRGEGSGNRQDRHQEGKPAEQHGRTKAVIERSAARYLQAIAN